MNRFIKKRYPLIITLILIFILSVSIYNAWTESAIFDETAHIGASYSYVKFSDMRLNPEHPPLIKDLAGIPLSFMGLNFNIQKGFWSKDVNGQWEAGKDFLYKENNDADKILFATRIPVILISLLLGLFIFKWTREIAGLKAGLLALILYSFDPNILGHNHFVTTDIGIAAFVTFSFYYFIKFIKEPSWKNMFLGGIFLGLVQLTKFSAIIIFPVFFLILILYPLLKIKKDHSLSNLKFRLRTLGNYLGKGLMAFLISLILVWVAYFANTYHMPKEKVADTINYYFNPGSSNPREAITAKTLETLNKSSITRPLSYYLLGSAMVFKRVAGGNSIYYMYQVSNQAFQSYFPIIFTIKEPLPTLLLYLTALVVSLAGFVKFLFYLFHNQLSATWEKVVHYLRTNVTSVALGTFILLYSYLSITGNLNLGVRHLFPILPFAYILTAKMLINFIKKSYDKRSDLILNFSIYFLVLFLILETIFAFPFYMSYFNQLAGGSKNGFQFVTDSNADWGQDLKRLKRFLDNNPEINKIRVDYFGGGDARYYLGSRYISWWDSKRPVEAGWYAISVNFLQGSLYNKEKSDSLSYRFLENFRPVAQIGTSILVYYLSPKDVAGIENQ